MKKIFISYSHKDGKWKDRLVKQLKVLVLEGFCDVWDKLLPVTFFRRYFFFFRAVGG